MHPKGLCGISPSFPELPPAQGSVTHVLRTRPPLATAVPACAGTARPVRLACVKRAASVRPEPGSNSPLNPYSLKSPSRSSFDFWFLLNFLTSVSTSSTSVGVLPQHPATLSRPRTPGQNPPKPARTSFTQSSCQFQPGRPSACLHPPPPVSPSKRGCCFSATAQYNNLVCIGCQGAESSQLRSFHGDSQTIGVAWTRQGVSSRPGKWGRG